MKNLNNLSMIINEIPVNVTKVDDNDYISLTDMAKASGADRAIQSWLRSKNTINFLGFWEQINNPAFKVHEFVYFKNNAGANSFNPSMEEWKVSHPELATSNKNQRDFATSGQLALIANLEHLNSFLINQGKTTNERIAMLIEDVVRQYNAEIIEAEELQKLEGGKNE